MQPAPLPGGAGAPFQRARGFLVPRFPVPCNVLPRTAKALTPSLHTGEYPCCGPWAGDGRRQRRRAASHNSTLACLSGYCVPVVSSYTVPTVSVGSLIISLATLHNVEAIGHARTRPKDLGLTSPQTISNKLSPASAAGAVQSRDSHQHPRDRQDLEGDNVTFQVPLDRISWRTLETARASEPAAIAI